MTKQKSITSIMEQQMDFLTDLEVHIANYFLSEGAQATDLSAPTIAQKLHVSQASLTRFAKKCGFKGYREFVFEYQTSYQAMENDTLALQNSLTKKVFVDYRELIDHSTKLIDEAQLQLIAEWIEEAERVYFYGKGSSALAAKEFKLRLMRLGVICESLDDTDSFTWTNSIVNDKCLVIGFSLSAKTKTVLDALQVAGQRGAKTVLITTQPDGVSYSFDEIIPVASARHLNYGNRISPQFPMLVVADIIYAYFLEINKSEKEKIFQNTIIDRS